VCPVCVNENKPLHRYCDFCWSLRPDWLPHSGAGSGRPMTDERRDSPRVVETQSSVDANSEPLASLDSGIMSPGSCDASRDTDERHPASNRVSAMDTRDDVLSADVERRDTSRGRKRSDLPSSGHSGALSTSSLCVICLVRPKNASIVHGTTGHQACCFHCARQLKQAHKPCPVCRRPIHKVIRNYVV